MQHSAWTSDSLLNSVPCQGAAASVPGVSPSLSVGSRCPTSPSGASVDPWHGHIRLRKEKAALKSGAGLLASKLRRKAHGTLLQKSRAAIAATERHNPKPDQHKEGYSQKTHLILLLSDGLVRSRIVWQMARRCLAAHSVNCIQLYVNRFSQSHSTRCIASEGSCCKGGLISQVRDRTSCKLSFQQGGMAQAHARMRLGTGICCHHQHLCAVLSN